MTTIKDIAVDQIHDSVVQNPRRQTDTAIAGLAKSIAELGIVTPLVVAKNGQGYIACDGHRRLASARALGIARVPCIIVDDGRAEVHWAALNGDTRRVGGADWFYGWSCLNGRAAEEFLERAPANTSHAIGWLVKHLSEERAREIGMRETVVPAALMGNALKILAYCASKDVSLPRMRLIEWLLKYGSGVAALFRSLPSKRVVQKFATRVRRDQAFPRTEW